MTMPEIKIFRISILLLISIVLHTAASAQYQKAAKLPPMGWNSYNAFGASVNENEVLQNAGFMKTHLKSFGWNYMLWVTAGISPSQEP